MARNSFIGTGGYTLIKEEWDEGTLQRIRDDLTILPRLMPGFGDSNAKSYYAYRESPARLYIPHYYGLRTLGTPTRFRIPVHQSITLPFRGSLRPTQQPVAQLFLNHCQQSPGQCGGALIEVPCGWGKTILGLYLIAAMSMKTMVVVGKEFLMDQWTERIHQCLPTARIGRIQGPIIDVEDKDIVLCMLQSLWKKDYPPTLFHPFGFMIVDEVHHISSQSFSNALFKVKTRFMLGLSATMQRKDGTTKLIEDLMGPIIFKGSRQDSIPVQVYGLMYESTDEAFLEIPTNFKGQVMYSSMISKLCTTTHRTEFILTAIHQLLTAYPSKQLMVLGHNKNVLTYIFDAIESRGWAKPGYYLGGMKPRDLKATEECRVVIATYMMAAEALDISTLSMLMMITPKTDIEQSVGRILRRDHNKAIVVDIIDPHSLYRNQWRKRRAFYKKQGYKINVCSTLPLTQVEEEEEQQQEEEEEDIPEDDPFPIQGCLLKP